MVSPSNEQHIAQSTSTNAASQASEPKRAWHPPQLISYGEVAEMTAGISYQPNDGISNLTL